MTENQSNDVDQIIADLPMASLASQLGVDPGTAASAVRQALPALLGGMQANAADPAGAASLSGAIDQHSPSLFAGGIDLEQVDVDDGQKIVGHVFGDNRQDVVQTLGQNLGSGGGGDLMQKLLPILAPIVLSYLAQRMRGGGAGQGAADQGGQGGGVGDLLGSILGGLGGGGQRQQGGGGILDMLGGMLGGGRR